MANTATVIIIVAGGATFTTEWYATRQINWKVPLATVILAAAFDGLSHVDPKAGTMLAFMVLLGALTTKFNGMSAMTILTQLGKPSAPPKTPKVTVA